MAPTWYFKADEKNNGPFGNRELKVLADRGIVTPDTLIWKNGMEKWSPASKIKGLFNSKVFDSFPELPADEEETKPYEPQITNSLISSPKPSYASNASTPLDEWDSHPETPKQNTRLMTETVIVKDEYFSKAYMFSKSERHILSYILDCITTLIVFIGLVCPWYSIDGSVQSSSYSSSQSLYIPGILTFSGILFAPIFFISIPLRFLPWKLCSLIAFFLSSLMILALTMSGVFTVFGIGSISGSASSKFGNATSSVDTSISFGWFICFIGTLGYSVFPLLTFFLRPRKSPLQ